MNKIFRGMMEESTPTIEIENNEDREKAFSAYKAKYPEGRQGASNPLAPAFEWWYKNEWKRKIDPVQPKSNTQQGNTGQGNTEGADFGYSFFDRRIGTDGNNAGDGYLPGHYYSIRTGTQIPAGWTIVELPDNIKAKMRPTKTAVRPGVSAIADQQTTPYEVESNVSDTALPLAYNRNEVFRGFTDSTDPREALAGWINNTETDRYTTGVFMPQQIAESGDPALIEAFVLASPYSSAHAGGTQGKPNTSAVSALQTALERTPRAAEQMATLRFLDPALVGQFAKNQAWQQQGAQQRGQQRTAQQAPVFLQGRK